MAFYAAITANFTLINNRKKTKTTQILAEKAAVKYLISTIEDVSQFSTTLLHC